MMIQPIELEKELQPKALKDFLLGRVKLSPRNEYAAETGDTLFVTRSKSKDKIKEKTNVSK